KPLLFGFRFEAPPSIDLTVSRHASVELTSTLIDEIQASTVLLEDGTEVTKMRLDIRNNTRQYLELTLPPASELTHALLDGHPVRPALAPGKPGTLLFTLRQSERVEPEGRTHEVRSGETLGGLAHRYFADPGKWLLILDANFERLGGSTNIQVGQKLKIPTDSSVTVEESAFVLELAYRSDRHGTLAGWGSADLTLPTLDVDAMRATWHVYVPSTLTALNFSTNLTQINNLRYGMLRRLEQFLSGIFGIGSAHAGGDYQSILTKRRSIYRDEARQKTMAEVAPATFPYVGERYRFKRVLSDAVAPQITFVYLSKGVTVGVHIAALLLALLLTVFVLRPAGRGVRWWRWPLGVVGMVGLLYVAHYVLGVHRVMVWGVLCGVVVALWRVRHRRPPSTMFAVLQSPWEFARMATPRNILIGLGLIVVADFVLKHPRLLPFAAILVLTVLWRSWATRPVHTTPPTPVSEVSHAAI
ncbi:MAG: LysM repeat protein, partial [Myxococcota bacterium]